MYVLTSRSYAQMVDVIATCRFLEWQPLYETERPYELLLDIPAGKSSDLKRSNLIFQGIEREIKDVKGQIEKFDLDRNGFAYFSYPSLVTADRCLDEDFVKDFYIPEVEQLLKTLIPDVERVNVFDWRVSSLEFYVGIIAASL